MYKSLASSQKTIGLDWQKAQLCKCITLFVHFIAVVARLRLETSELVSTTKKISFSKLANI